jgi:hypothetical protein
MFETIKTIREAFDVPTWAFILISASLGSFLFAIGGWVVDRVYQKGMHPPSSPPAQIVNASPPQQLPPPKPSGNPGKRDRRGDKTVKHKPSQINQTSNAPYSQNIVAGDQAQITITNPPPNPYGAVVTWDYNGAQRSQSPGRANVTAGDELGKFEAMLQFESRSDWQSLLKSSQEQIKLTPSWPTPYLFAAEANVHLGNLTLAEQQLQAVERSVSDNPDYAQHISKVRELLRTSQ